MVFWNDESMSSGESSSNSPPDDGQQQQQQQPQEGAARSGEGAASAFTRMKHQQERRDRQRPRDSEPHGSIKK
jgi:hypothetical protein